MSESLEPTAGLFVYGTLKREEINHPLVASCATRIEPARVRGQLYDVGEFPALVKGDGLVHGELVWIRAGDLSKLLSRIDQLENYDPESPEDSMYVREIVETWTDSGTSERAYAYFYNPAHPALLPTHALRGVESGVWRGSQSGVSSGHEALEDYRRFVRTFVAGQPEPGGTEVTGCSEQQVETVPEGGNGP